MPPTRTDVAGRPGHLTSAQAVRYLRAGVGRAAVGAGIAAVYLLATLGSPRRPLMLAVVGGMLAVIGLVHLAAPAIARSRYTFFIQAANVVLVITGMGVLLHLDGGPASPIGAIVAYALLFFAITVPRRMFTVVCVVGGLAYAVVALVAPSPQGYAPMIMMGALGIGWLSRRYASGLAAIRRRLSELSTVDPLTGCLNRRGFDQRLDGELAHARTTGEHLALVLIDLDRFKQVNDTHGHAVGDDLLAWTGRTLVDTVRTHDVVGRIGGDEFAVLLVGADAVEAAASTDRIRRALAPTTPGSYGFAVLPADGSDADALRLVADERLYLDKATQGGIPEPSTDAVLAVRSTAPARPDPTVGRADRLRRSVLDLGLLAAFCHAAGLLYVLVLSGGRSNTTATAAALSVGAATGIVTVAAVDRITRSRHAAAIMLALAVPEFASAFVAAYLDGGLASPIAFGLVAPLPMVAYGSPPRKAVPVIVAVLAVYGALGVLLGGVSAWFAILHMGGSATVAAFCAQLGRVAAVHRRHLEELSRSDVMTGCLNRRGFGERFAEEVSHARRSGGSVGLLLIDLDGLKLVNDTRGHAAGDELLVWVAATLLDQLAPDGIVGRLGGDEFAVLLTAARPEAPADIIARLRRAVAERAQLSMGLATLGPDGTEFDELYAVADGRLYAEKAAGRQLRNRAVVEVDKPQPA